MNFLHSLKKGAIILGIIGMLLGLGSCLNKQGIIDNRESMWICPSCNSENRMADRFCPECGTKKPNDDTNDAQSTIGGTEFKTFDGAWINQNKTNKLVIEGDKLTYYIFTDGKFIENGSCQIMQKNDKIVNANGESGIYIYRNIRLTGHGTLEADLDIKDAPTHTEDFAREGWEQDFTPEPIYPKKANEIADKTLQGFHVSVGSIESLADRLGISELEKSVVECSLFIEFDQAGQNIVHVSAMDGSRECIEQYTYQLSNEKLEALTEILLSKDVLRANPFRDGSDMARSGEKLFLYAIFKSGEQIKIESRYDYKIGKDKASEILRLLYFTEEKQAEG